MERSGLKWPEWLENSKEGTWAEMASHSLILTSSVRTNGTVNQSERSPCLPNRGREFAPTSRNLDSERDPRLLGRNKTPEVIRS